MAAPARVEDSVDSGHSGIVDAPSSDADPSAAHATRHLSDVVSAWYAPLRSEQPWRSTAYLLAGAAVSVVWFVVALVAMAVSLPLVLVGVGVPMVVASFALLAKLAGVERRRATWVGYDVDPASFATARRGVRGLGDRFRDPARWRMLGYFLLAPLLFGLLAGGALAAWLTPLYLVTLPLWGWAVGLSVLGLITSVVAGVVLAGVAPRVADLLGRVGGRVVEVLLGPDRMVAMQARVDSLTLNREQMRAAVAAERRRIERNLHDGVQPQLVALGIDLGLAANKLETDPDGALALLRDAQRKNRATIGELRQIGRGLHPAILDDRGLDAALSAVVASAPIPIALDVQPGLEMPVDVAEAAYYVVAEGVSNMLKHADARTGSLRVRAKGNDLTVDIHDDGRGGADAANGTGLAGIAARVRGLDGTIDITSPSGGPTTISIALPMSAVPND